MDITFNFEKTISLSSRNYLKQFLQKLFNSEKVAAESLAYVFCSDEFLLQINQQYLQHDYYTDIISFNLSDNVGSPVIGEIYISVDRIKANAKTFHSTVEMELHRVIFHGALHLCGYKDKTNKDKELMTKKEDLCLSKYFHGKLFTSRIPI
jgi:rRNA maturation RNase YbeY